MPAVTPPPPAASLSTQVLDTFRQRTGDDPEGLWRAPGRANLLGEHTDYNEGYALPFAIDRGVVAAVRRRRDDVLHLTSIGVGDATLRLSDVGAGRPTGWAAYVAGPVWALVADGMAPTGLDIVVGSDVPVGAGLSSSAAVQCAVALALDELSGRDSDRTWLARLVQRSENTVVGAPVGLLDQMASLLAVAGSALVVDFRGLTARAVPLPLDGAGLQLLVLDTRVAHSHVSGSYAQRREGCEQAAALLGVRALRDVSSADVEAAAGLLGPLLPLARHVASDDERVLAAVQALARSDVAALGPLLSTAHASLRDDFGVSCPELDVAVAAAETAGALGARMIGGGFGGSALALVPAGSAARVAEAAGAAARQRGFPVPDVYAVRPEQGAARIAG